MSRNKQYGVMAAASGLLLLLTFFPSILTAAVQPQGDSVDGNRPQIQQPEPGPIVRLKFDGTLDNWGRGAELLQANGPVSFVRGLTGQALSVGERDSQTHLSLGSDGFRFEPKQDFSVQFWVRSVADSDDRFVLLSSNTTLDNSLASQKMAGWRFYVTGGTWAWNMGSGNRRITYERDNGVHMPMNDGRWHQLTMTYDRESALVRLFYDGDNRATYNVRDSDGFDFTSHDPVAIGWNGPDDVEQLNVLPLITHGAANLQSLVDTFNGYGLAALEPEELVHLVVDPEELFDRKVSERAAQLGADSTAFRMTMDSVDWEPISAIERELMDNPYTVHQVLYFMEVAPLTKIYSLVDGRVTINEDAARTYAAMERLDPPEYDLDDLAIWDRALSPEEVLASYSDHFVPAIADLEEEITSLTAGCWNIWHGGKHANLNEHGSDSRVTIAEILRREGTDVVMMQETYSSGDFIAAELGYYFATTADIDYLNQGSNISVLSRYPIKEIFVQGDSPFMNVGARVSISETQDVYVMSNWYGMRQFQDVFDFHQNRFRESDSIPTLFAGDFNAVPHTDGGDSPASVALLNAGFTDAFRSKHPDVTESPGLTHRSGSRIDQVYYKGAGLHHTDTHVVSTWPSGFPSDHYLIVSKFDLDYTTIRGQR